MRNYVIDDFSGGERGEYATKRAANECAKMVNLWPQGRNLRPMKSHVRLAHHDHAASTDTFGPFLDHTLYVGPEGEEYLVARQGKTLWLGVKSTTNWTSLAEIDWRPLFGDIWSFNANLLTARGNTCREDFAQVGSLLYMTSETPTATDYMLRFDGFQLRTGTLKYLGVNLGGEGIYEAADTDYDFETAGVKCGDILWLKDHSLSGSDGGQWRVGADSATHGFVITGIGGVDTATEVAGGEPSQTHTAAPGAFLTDGTWTNRASAGALATNDNFVAIISSATPPPQTTVLTGSITVDAVNPAAGCARFHIGADFYVATGVISQELCYLPATSSPPGGMTMTKMYVWKFTNGVTDATTYYDSVVAGSYPVIGTGRLLVATANAGQCFDTTGKGAGATDYVDHQIVRLVRAGMPAATPCGASLVSLQTDLDVDTYRYAWRYKNSVTGYSGEISAMSNIVTVTGGMNSITVTGWALAPDDVVDTLQIFRQQGAGLFYLVKEVDRLATHDWNRLDAFVDQYVDNGWAIQADAYNVSISLETDAIAALHGRPPALRGVRYFNGRLYAAEATDRVHWLAFSNLDDVEYWPELDYTIDVTLPTYTQAGGRVQIGASRKEPITAILPEGGAWSTNGVSGNNLLVFTSSQAVRWYGLTWADFQHVPAFSIGCCAPHTAINAGGTILWATQNHIMALTSSSNSPVPISEKLWPVGIQTDMDVAAEMATLAKWSAAFWNGCYFLTGTLDHTHNNTIWVLHIPSGAWFEMDAEVNDLVVWDNLGSDDTLIMTACESVSVASAASILALFGGTWASESVWESGALPFASNSSERYKAWKIRRILLCWHGASGPSDVDIQLFDNFKSTVVDSTHRTVPNKPESGRGFHTIEWAPGAQCIEPSIRLEMTARHELRLERLIIEHEPMGDAAAVR